MNVSVSKVALVGSACRLPEAVGLDAFWDVLAQGRCVISEVQEERFGTRQHVHPDRRRPGRSVTFAAGQLARPYHFDPGYFGISPREAAVMDPQQRLLLEVAVEALENAGVRPDALAGSEVGVYVGASSLDYGTHAQLDPAAVEPQSMTGNTLSIIANRLSYVLDLRGPSYVVDTACSSSLIALHNAVEDIRLGRIETAIVGGVSLLLHPIPFIGFSRASMLSPHGLCRAFDAAADGYVRSEGAVALVLRAEEAARAGGEAIQARLVASGINADGRTAGLSLPSTSAQAELLRTVYEGASLDPERLAFVEAHGTGTRVGDPVEAEAIGRILATRRRSPLLIGSAKTNFGHLEPASGLVGVLKARLALAHDLLPASLHFETPNPDIPFEDLNLRVVREATALPPQAGEPRLAGVNSFGFGGANAHVVLADGDPADAAQPVDPAGVVPADAPLVLSAASKASLAALAAATLPRFAADPARYANAAAHRRQRLAHRAVVAAAEAPLMREALEALAAGTDHPLVSVAEAVVPAQRPVFVYSGNGSQWVGMGRAAYRDERDFRVSFDRTDRAFMSLSGWSLVTMLFSEDLETEIERTEIAQPLLFTLQVAMTEALARKGLTPALVLGHSVGEVAAAWASGALTLADAVRVIHARSTHQEITRHLGGMAALLLPPEEAREAIALFAGLELAAVNSSRSVTISGPSDALAAFAKVARTRRWAVKRLDLDYPFHCALVDPIREPLLQSLAGLAPRPCVVPFVSCVTGAAQQGPGLDASYWWENVRRPVLFREAAAAAVMQHRVFVEIGPRPVLTAYLNDAARGAEVKAAVLASFLQGDAATDPVAAVVRRALAHGAAVDDDRLFGERRAPAAMLPTYPWQHEEFRASGTIEKVRLDGLAEHALLGTRLRADMHDWRSTLCPVRLPFLADHMVESAVVFPAAGYVEMLAAVGRALHPGAAVEIRDLDIFAPLVLDFEAEREVRTREVAPATFLIESRTRLSSDGWSPHVKATVAIAPAPPAAPAAPAAAAGAPTVPAARLYEMTASFGLPYGPTFRRAEAVTLFGGMRARVQLAPPDPATARFGFALDPTLFDSCFHALFAFLAERGVAAGSAVLPIRLGRLLLADDGAAPTHADILVRLPTEGVVEADFVLRDDDGTVIAIAEAVRFLEVALGRDGAGETLVAAPLLKRVSRHAEPAALSAGLAPGLLAPDGEEPSETALLIEAGVQAAARDALRPLFVAPATLAEKVAEGRLATDAAPLAARLLMALEAAGSAQRDERGWRVEGEGIGVSDIVGLLVAEHPQRLAEAAVLSALPEWLASAFETGLAVSGPPLSSALMEQLLQDSDFAAPVHEALVRTVAALLEEGDAAVRLGVLGAQNVRLLRALAALVDPARTRLVVTDRDSSVLDRARLGWQRTAGVEFAPFEELGDDHPFDAIVLPPTLGPVDLHVRSLLKAGGALVGGAFAPSLFADALGGLEAAWWSGSVDAESPVGRLATVGEWRCALAEAGLEVREVGLLASPETDALLFAAERAREAAASSPATAPRLPSLHAEGEAARRMCVALSAMVPAEAEPAPVHDLAAAPPGEGPCLVALDEPDAAALPQCLGRLGAFLAALGPETRAVTLVTFGAQVEGRNEIRPAAAAIAAFGRVALNEFPHLELRLVDVAPSFDASVAAVRVHAELAQPNREREVVLASDQRAAMRYVPATTASVGAGGAVRLAVPRRGSIDHLEWQQQPVTEPGPNEVRLRNAATGLNFRDVMWTLGLLPHEALQDGFAGPTLGMECAGTVEAVGAQVDGLSPGDAVIAFAPASFASHVTVSAGAVVRRPQDLPAAAAATIPVAFLTAYYALVELGGLEEDETVLIHGGAGGVGLAALQIARWRGARAFATAGTAEKRALLRRLGAEAVFDSRALTFADEARAATGGEGVDVVLNSLAGEAMERSLSTLRPFGRFLELGKRDFYADTKLGLRPFRQNLSYFGIDADQLMKHRPKLARRVLGTIMGLFEAGELTPLPYRPFAAEGVRDAFRLMQSAGHIGKIIVEAPTVPAPPAVAEPAPRGTAIAADKAYLLVGGTSGFGFATAEWLIAQGARHLVLASRSGVRDEDIAAALERHRSDGIDVRVVALDVTDAAAVRAQVAAITAERPLGGVFHMAMVLDDALITSLDAARHAAVLAPKVAGVLALEEATRDVALDLFVLYSSITVQLGNPGQANYVAANAFLEAVARRRRAAGKPALAVAWGAIADVGVVARDSQTNELLQKKLGRHAVTAAEALAVLAGLLESGALVAGPAVRMIGKVDWAAARKDLALAGSPSFEDLADEADTVGESAGVADLAERLKGLTDTQAVAEVSRLLAAEISRILKLPAAEVDMHKPLTALGMDSLMGVELRMAAEQRIGVDIPLMSLAAGATLADLARKVVQRGRGSEGPADVAAETLKTVHLAGNVEAAAEFERLESAIREKSEGMRTITR